MATNRLCLKLKALWVKTVPVSLLGNEGREFFDVKGMNHTEYELYVLYTVERRLIYSVVDVICRCGIIPNHVITHLKLKGLSLHFFYMTPVAFYDVEL